MPRCVNLYLAERRFGGPEEGGWYYTHLTFVETALYTATTHQEMLAEAATRNEGRPSIHSVLSNGLYVVYIEDTPGCDQPIEKPVYT